MSFHERYTTKIEQIRNVNHFMPSYNFTATGLEAENLNYAEIKGLLKQKWTLYSTTPLWNISYDQIESGHMNNWLSEQIESFYPSTAYCAQFSILPGCSGKMKQPIQVSILKTFNNKSTKMVYCAVFLNHGLLGINNIAENCLHLPLILCSGDSEITKRIHAVFMKCFDCVISEMCFSQFTMKWLAGIITHCAEDTTAVKFVYSTTLKSEIELTCTIPYSNLESVWHSVHSESDNTITTDEIMKFHMGLEEHLYNCLVLDITKFHLKTISISGKITINVLGKIQSTQKDMLGIVLGFLTDFVISKKQLQFE